MEGKGRLCQTSQRGSNKIYSKFQVLHARFKDSCSNCSENRRFLVFCLGFKRFVLGIPWIFEIRAKDSGIHERFWVFTKDSGISRKILGFHERFRDFTKDSEILCGIQGFQVGFQTERTRFQEVADPSVVYYVPVSMLFGVCVCVCVCV